MGVLFIRGRVVHCVKSAFDVYIGRPTLMFEGVGLGNPFTVGEHGRDEAIHLFEGYARQKLITEYTFNLLVKSLYGKTLGCWCFPRRCHGEVLLRLAAELNQQPSLSVG